MWLEFSPTSLHRRGNRFSRGRGSIKAIMHPAPEILSYLASGGVVVAANPRASRVLRRAYANWQLANSVNAWHSPAVVDWSGFLTSFWQQHIFAAANPPLLLTPIQESWLWQ